ncbi:MAG: hypothetical protein R3E42_12115 [Burkholderiaceae bacterium]
MNDKPRYWFPRKRYGWGWGFPSSWQGWVVLAAYAIAMLVGAALFDPSRNAAGFIVCTALATAALVVVCWQKGEPAGKRSSSK